MSLSRKLMARRRVVMRPSATVLHGLLQLGRYNHSAAHPGLNEHIHRNAIEVCYLVKGRQTYRVGDNLYRLRGGDVFVTFPDEVHDTGGLPEEKGALYWMVLKMPMPAESFLGLPAREGAALSQALRNLPRRHFRGSREMKEHLDAVTRLYHEPARPLRSCAMANQLVAFLLEVIAAADHPAASAPIRPLAPVLAYIEAHLDEPLGIPELARLAGLSEARFKVRFKEESGVPPGDYVQRARIEEARHRIAAGNKSITRVAFDLGFSSSQYFSTVFKRFTGRSPREA